MFREGLFDAMKKLAVLLTLIIAPLTAAADETLTPGTGVVPTPIIGDDLAALRSQIGWGASINPDRVSFNSEGGYNGGAGRATVSASVEARVIARASVFANVQFGGIYDHGKPAVGAAYQIIDPRKSDYGLRVSGAYKPEGFSEPEGEIEAVVVASRKLGANVVRAMAAYGQDPEGAESDFEVGASYNHRVADRLVVGATTRWRRAIRIKPGKMEPNWDLISGAVGGFVLPHRTRVELLAGVSTVSYATTTTGFLGLVSFGTEL
jgi:hypothetical protein